MVIILVVQFDCDDCVDCKYKAAFAVPRDALGVVGGVFSQSSPNCLSVCLSACLPACLPVCLPACSSSSCTNPHTLPAPALRPTFLAPKLTGDVIGSVAGRVRDGRPLWKADGGAPRSPIAGPPTALHDTTGA